MIKLTKNQAEKLNEIYDTDMDGTIWVAIRKVLDVLEIGFDRKILHELIFDEVQNES